MRFYRLCPHRRPWLRSLTGCEGVKLRFTRHGVPHTRVGVDVCVCARCDAAVWNGGFHRSCQWGIQCGLPREATCLPSWALSLPVWGSQVWALPWPLSPLLRTACHFCHKKDTLIIITNLYNGHSARACRASYVWHTPCKSLSLSRFFFCNFFTLLSFSHDSTISHLSIQIFRMMTRPS